MSNIESIVTSEVEEKVRQILIKDPKDIVELTDLSEHACDYLKIYFSESYKVEGIVRIVALNQLGETRYTLHIRKK